MTKKTNSKTTTTPAPQVTRIIKISTCPTCSGKANLTYHFGVSADNTVYIRVVSNSGGGFFSDEWVKLADIQAALASAPFPVTSFPLIKLFIGKSVNNSGFLLAVIKHEGLVKLLEGKIRGYEKLDDTQFMREVNALVNSDIDLKVENPAPVKKPNPVSAPTLKALK